MEFQLRNYRIADGKLDQFVDEWRRHVLPLRKKMGFTVVGPWVSRDENRFVWVVGCDGDLRFEDKRYYESDERKEIEPDPARLVVDSANLWLEETI